VSDSYSVTGKVSRFTFWVALGWLGMYVVNVVLSPARGAWIAFTSSLWRLIVFLPVVVLVSQVVVGPRLLRVRSKRQLGPADLAWLAIGGIVLIGCFAMT
jgi:uncharacterized membrane protein YhaH (DUF805 family)